MLVFVKDSNPDILIFQPHQWFLFSTLMLCLSTTPRVFTEVWILVLGEGGGLVMGYLHDLLLREQSAQTVEQPVKDQKFNCVLDFRKLLLLVLTQSISGLLGL